ncbi:MetQ/NlpA family ABC transporter substrate-binding protein [Neobacillus sp. SuZ13]|uniref:MetQ/NlpA family ABC transporter substrate-binding protein n=1 Tax=Neobacillus sp. SuZ13 TaxID=3047875 RepID=UPI0024BF5299|nr:MetQ/NlpA family ABC transporter substrate-binding protein [Neobacillus sp. SuZ13]WHY68802.1 MetQ/NlpA family ABC transporter substrate-binding protein [Neobacillus sp. SuZ13]
MKKILLPFLPILILIGVVLSGCGVNKETSTTAKGSSQKEAVLKVGASSTPHAEILKFIEPELKKQGIKLDIVVINDGIQTNQQTANGELDANYFQHIPYLNQVNKDSGLDLVSVKGIHIEPFGVYSKKIKSIDNLSDGAKIAIPKDPVNFSRALQLFAANGLIELKQKEKDNFDYTLEDITKNDKHLKFIGVDGPVLVRSLDDIEAAAINTNYALEGGFKPKKDALIIESDQSPYVNILVADKSRKNDKNIQKLAKALTTEEVRKFIEDKYQGAVVPAF